MEIGSDGVRRHNGLDFSEIPALVDDGYWEALLDQGEVVTAEAPPPWIDTERRGDLTTSTTSEETAKRTGMKSVSGSARLRCSMERKPAACL